MTHYLPKPEAGEAKVQRPGGSSLGFNARNEGYQQTLNTSRSSLKLTEARKERLAMSGTVSLPELPVSPVALPGMSGNRSLGETSPFQRTRPAYTPPPKPRDMPAMYEDLGTPKARPKTPEFCKP